MNSVLKLGKVGGGAIPHENWERSVEGQFCFQIGRTPWTRPESVNFNPKLLTGAYFDFEIGKGPWRGNSLFKLG
jgi:hypothetical protein